MTVRTLTQPDNSTQTGAQYKGNIDDAINVVAQIGGAFAPHAKASPDLTVLVDAGRLFANGALASQSQQTVSGFVAAASTQRIDRIVLDQTTGAASRVAGVESGSPAAPAVPAGKFPIAQVGPFTTATTAIANSLITDERPLLLGTLATLALTGLLDLSASGAGQIAFPATQNPSSNANTLDDYEEGTWSPTPGGTATLNSQIGEYTKIGRAVFVRLNVQINALGTGSNAALLGLPFTSLNTGNHNLTAEWTNACASNIVFLGAHVNNGNTTITLPSATAATNALSINAIFAAGLFTSVAVSGMYHTS